MLWKRDSRQQQDAEARAEQVAQAAEAKRAEYASSPVVRRGS